jgi:hypothetical protein
LQIKQRAKEKDNKSNTIRKYLFDFLKEKIKAKNKVSSLNA